MKNQHVNPLSMGTMGGGPLYIEFFPSKSGKKDVLHCLGNGKICYL